MGLDTLFIKVILDCAHFLDLGRFEYETRGRAGWALPTNIYARHAGCRVGTAHHWITQQSGTRTIEPARYGCHSKSSAPQILNLRFKWWAVPTLRCGAVDAVLRILRYSQREPAEMKKNVAGALFVLFTATLISATSGGACTRAVYQGHENTVITARSMDWKDEIPANLWLFPRAMQRNGAAGPNSVTWRSRYGSIVASAFDIAGTDGMNEKGLVANLLWLAESRYPEYDSRHKGLSIAAWVQYVLDHFATVAEAVEALRAEPFVVVSTNIPGTDTYAALHLSISDVKGDNAIFEYIDGKLVVHHDSSYTVMTNSPIFEKQLALNEYWKQVGGAAMLPGTNRAADRFVRASFYMDAIPQTSDPRIAVASVFSVIRNASVPFGISSKEQPNISSTRWRSVSDQKHLVYYFETALTPNTFWVDLKRADFSVNAPVLMLPLVNHESYAGDALDSFKPADPFKFAGVR
jgi:penicillin V acylase-like amidase (Ntn superfamily)